MREGASVLVRGEVKIAPTMPTRSWLGQAENPEGLPKGHQRL